MASLNEHRPRLRPGGARPLPSSPQSHPVELPPQTAPLNIRSKTPTPTPAQRLLAPRLDPGLATPKRPITPLLSLQIPAVNGRSELPLDTLDLISTTTTGASTSDSPTDINRTLRPPVSSGEPADSGYDKIREAINDMSIHGDNFQAHVPSDGESKPGYGSEYWTDEDLEDLGRLGEGAGGAVHRVKDRRSNTIMARKTIPTRTTPSHQLLRELSFMSNTVHPNIIIFHGAYISPSSSEVKVLMEVCDGGSLDAVGKRVRESGRRISEKVAGKIGEGIFNGLAYLHTKKIVHRDIKPSNVLLSRKGMVKLCDFGVSGELVDSHAGTFTGTGYYMAPERIQGQKYTIRSDVWSSGLTLMELAMNRFPYPDDLENPIELMSFIVRGEIPKLQDEEDCTWSQEMKDFINLSLTISPMDRPTPKEMLEQKWLVNSAAVKLNMGRWIREVWGWDEQKKPPRSHPSSGKHPSQDIPPWAESPPMAAFI